MYASTIENIMIKDQGGLTFPLFPFGPAPTLTVRNCLRNEDVGTVLDTKTAVWRLGGKSHPNPALKEPKPISCGDPGLGQSSVTCSFHSLYRVPMDKAAGASRRSMMMRFKKIRSTGKKVEIPFPHTSIYRR